MIVETYDLELVGRPYLEYNDLVYQEDGEGFWVKKEDFDKVEDLLLTAISLLGSVSYHEKEWLEDKERVIKYLEINND